MGFEEIMNNSLTKSSYYEGNEWNSYLWENTVKVMNPLSADLGVMRQSMLFGGLESIVRNVNRKNANLRFTIIRRTGQRKVLLRLIHKITILLCGLLVSV